MSSASTTIASLVLTQKNLYKFGGPILMSVGTVSCILSLIVFSKRNLRKNPCSIYLIAFNVASFLLIYTSILLTMLPNGYQIDPSLHSLGFCRFHFYTLLLFDVLTPSYLILASIDRILVTSPNALTRRRSTVRLAHICIIIVTLFWLLFHSHALFFTNIIEPIPGFIHCYFQSGIYLVFIGYYSIIIKGIVVPLLMIILGLWTVKNIRRMGRVTPNSIVPTNGRTVIGGLHSAHSKDRQLLQILLINISIYIIFSSMISVVLMYQQITQYYSKNLVQIQMQAFLVSVGTFSSYIPFCIECYTNLLVSKTFRHEVKKVLMYE